MSIQARRGDARDAKRERRRTKKKFKVPKRTTKHLKMDPTRMPVDTRQRRTIEREECSKEPQAAGEQQGAREK